MQTRLLLPVIIPLFVKPAPDEVLKLIHCNCLTTRCATYGCSCGKFQMLCTEFCACNAETCLSKWTLKHNEGEDEVYMYEYLFN